MDLSPIRRRLASASLRCICAALGALITALPVPTAHAGAEVTALVGGTVIDGTGAKPLANAIVLIEGERVAAVGRSDAVAVPDGAHVVDVRGKWIIPGLIDAHIHFFQSGGLYTRPDILDLREVRPYAEELAWIQRRLPATLARYLASGVTAVVDVGGPFSNFAVRELARRTALAPRVAVAGPLLGTFAPPELETDDPPVIHVTGPEDARTLVRRELEHKPDLVKLWLVDVWGRGLGAELDWIRAAIEESHAGGVRVVVHATEREAVRAAVRAGADVLAHSVRDSVLDEALIALLKERDVVYTTTLVVSEGYHEVLGQQVELTDIERRLGDPEVIATFADMAGLPWHKVPFWARFQEPPSHAVAFENLRRVQAAGVTVAAGSDAGNIGTLHGPALHRELELMAEAGLEPMDILVAATYGGARVMGREAELGTIEAGKLADLVVLDADPLADIRNTRLIHRVVKGGVVLDPEEILEQALKPR